MLIRKTILTAILFTLLAGTCGFGESLEENWNDYLHYTKIGHLDLAKGYAQAILQSNPEPVLLLDLSQGNPVGYAILLRVKDTAADAELVQLTSELIDVIEAGKFIRRTDPKTIVTEVERLVSGNERAWLTAVRRLQNSGEYAIMYMLNAMADTSDDEKLADLIRALPKIGRDGIRPLAAALQTSNTAIKAEIIKALGKIGYPQSLAYLKYVVENDESEQLREFARASIGEIDPAALKVSAAQLFYRLGENYYYHAESLKPAQTADFANIWFWDAKNARLLRKEVDRNYFYELMAMRACEWTLKADASFGKAIGLWQAAFFKAESDGVAMPDYFGPNHADASVYATTAGPEYLHQALARAVKDKNPYVALGAIEALAVTAGEKSLLYRFGPAQPLVGALTFDNKAVKYSAAIAIATAGPKHDFAESSVVVKNLADALAESGQTVEQDTTLWDARIADSYALRAGGAMLKLVQTENPVIDLSAAEPTLINATKDQRPKIQILAGRILAQLKTPQAQMAIAAMALNEDNSLAIRIAAFNSLAVSAKFNASLLEPESLEAIYALVSSTDKDQDLRSAAAAAFGALNLPSQKVKDLILDQARS